MLAAHAIPPSAFQNRNVGQRILFMPGQPRRRDPQARDPAAEEHRLRAVPGEEGLAVLEDLQPVLEHRAGVDEHAVARSGGRSRSRRCRRGSPRWRRGPSASRCPCGPGARAARRRSARSRPAPGCPSSRSRSGRTRACSRRSPGCRSGRRTRHQPISCRGNGDRNPDRLRDLRAARAGELGAAAGVHAVGRGADVARDVGGRRGAAHLAPRPGPPAALEPGHAPREHRGAEVRGRDRRARRDGLRRRRPVAPSSGRWSASTTCTSSRTACPTARCARSSPSRARASAATGSTRRPFSSDLRARAARRARGGGRGRARRRVLRPRRRPALQHAPPRSARSPARGRHRRLPDRRARDGPVRRGRAPVRAARLPHRLRQRRQGRGDAGRARWSRYMAASAEAFAVGPARRAAAHRRARGRPASSTASRPRTERAPTRLSARSDTRTVVSAWPEMRKSSSRKASPRTRPMRSDTPSKRSVARTCVGELVERRRAGVAALVLLLVVAEDDRREGVRRPGRRPGRRGAGVWRPRRASRGIAQRVGAGQLAPRTTCSATLHA